MVHLVRNFDPILTPLANEFWDLIPEFERLKRSGVADVLGSTRKARLNEVQARFNEIRAVFAARDPAFAVPISGTIALLRFRQGRPDAREQEQERFFTPPVIPDKEDIREEDILGPPTIIPPPDIVPTLVPQNPFVRDPITKQKIFEKNQLVKRIEIKERLSFNARRKLLG